jgi:uncharacterized protein (DUF433 family)
MTPNKTALLILLGATLMTSSAAMAGSKVSCTQIRKALQSGKTTEQVAKDLKVSATQVKNCSAQKHSSNSK